MSDEFVKLAKKKISNQLSALLVPHKIALFALENQAAELMKEKILDAPDNKKLQTARIVAKAAYQTSAKLAYQHSLKEFQVLNIAQPDKPPKMDNSYIDKMMNDLKTSFADNSLTDSQKANRASLAAGMAANRAYTDTQLAMYDKIPDHTNNVQKVWVTNQDVGSQPCKFCLELHNTSVPLDSAFPIPKGIKPYDGLQGPPLHPRCRCRLVSRIMS